MAGNGMKLLEIDVNVGIRWIFLEMDGNIWKCLKKAANCIKYFYFFYNFYYF